MRAKHKKKKAKKKDNLPRRDAGHRRLLRVWMGSRHFLPPVAPMAAATGGELRLVDRGIDEAARDAATVEAWRRQRRSLERLPAPLADALFRRLAARRVLFPSLLE